MTPLLTTSVSLQIALDRIPLDRAERITHDVSGAADWIEVGTSLVKRYGMSGVERIAAAAGSTPVLADLKTADDARTELTMAAEAGARSVTVLGVSTPSTLDLAVRVAADLDIELMVDLMALDADGRARVAARMPDTAVLAAHVPKDAQTTDTDPAALLGAWATGRRLALAGGLGVADVPAVAAWGDVRLIVGSSVTAAPDPARAAAALRDAIDSLTLKEPS
jgi:3-keto-L-gulonate-6-phosphate decarboxylase